VRRAWRGEVIVVGDGVFVFHGGGTVAQGSGKRRE